MKQFEYADEKQKNLYKNFPTTHWLSNPTNVDNMLLWGTFFRRNLHRYAIDVLGIKLYLYQAIIIYLLGRCKLFVIIASRATAKSFTFAVFAVCYCSLHSTAKFVLASGTKGQAKLIVDEKIKNELMQKSDALRRDVADIKSNANEVIVIFRNHSTITVVPASDTARGNRSTAFGRDEFRQIKKDIEDSVLSPCQITLREPYMFVEPYCNMPELIEEPIDIYMSSSWIDDGHWMWDLFDGTFADMVKNGNEDKLDSCVMALDESVVLKYQIKTQAQLQKEKKKQDDLTWRIEFLNERVKENTSAYFTYKMLMNNQRAKKPFYPLQVGQKKKKPYNVLNRQKGEIRVVSCDMAFITKKNNDNSIFSCIRAIPESTTYNSVEVTKGYRRIVCYMEHHQGGETNAQAIRIRQLYEDFDADYIVLDTRNGGVGIYDNLARIMYDEERDVEYSPICCMNDDNLKDRVRIDGAEPVIFAISASSRLNTTIATEFREVLTEHKIDLLVNLKTAKEEILGEVITDYDEISTDAITQLFFETPFLETQLLVSETAKLIYEKNLQTGAISVYEQGNNTKDRYTSVSYGSYFIGLMEKNLLSTDTQDELSKYKSCATSVDF